MSGYNIDDVRVDGMTTDRLTLAIIAGERGTYKIVRVPSEDGDRTVTRVEFWNESGAVIPYLVAAYGGPGAYVEALEEVLSDLRFAEAVGMPDVGDDQV